MANSVIKKEHVFNHDLSENESFTFPIRGCTYILAFNHPYTSGTKGLYLVIGGYTTSSVCILPILESADITITKPTNSTCKVETSKPTFMTVIGGGKQTFAPRHALGCAA